MPSTDPESPFDVRVRASAARGRTRRDEAPTDAAWIDAVIAEEPWAQRRFVEALSPRIRRVLTRVLGGGADIDDLTQDTLLRALSRLGTLREKDKLEAFVAKIAVFVGREALRARRRRRWLRFFAPEDVPELPSSGSTAEGRRAVTALYAALGSLDVDTQLAFTLRHVEGLELTEVAELTELSLATVKRRLLEAERSLLARAPDLKDLVAEFSS